MEIRMLVEIFSSGTTRYYPVPPGTTRCYLAVTGRRVLVTADDVKPCHAGKFQNIRGVRKVRFVLEYCAHIPTLFTKLVIINSCIIRTDATKPELPIH
eukprot:1190384-Amorphochlora_amoeboformis.AAC.1